MAIRIRDFMAEVEWILGTVDRFCGFGRMGIWGAERKKKNGFGAKVESSFEFFLQMSPLSFK